MIPGRTEVVPQAAILLGWAAELGIAIGDGAAGWVVTAQRLRRRQCR